MVSKTRMLEWIKSFHWKDVEAGLAEAPQLVGFRDAKGRNWLHLCCGVSSERRGLNPADGVRTARVLLNAGLDINQEAFREGQWKATPLWYAVARGGNLPLIRFLLESGSDPNHCLWAAGFRDDTAAIRLLVKSGAEIDPVAEDETPFLAAVKWSHFRAAGSLLARGADVNFQDRRGMAALHYMLKKNSDQKHFRVMIKFGARGDLANGQGITAAEIMARKRAPGFRKLAKQLCGAAEAEG